MYKTKYIYIYYIYNLYIPRARISKIHDRLSSRSLVMSVLARWRDNVATQSLYVMTPEGSLQNRKKCMTNWDHLTSNWQCPRFSLQMRRMWLQMHLLQANIGNLKIRTLPSSSWTRRKNMKKCWMKRGLMSHTISSHMFWGRIHRNASRHPTWESWIPSRMLTSMCGWGAWTGYWLPKRNL